MREGVAGAPRGPRDASAVPGFQGPLPALVGGLAPGCRRFAATAAAVGGGMPGSWDLSLPTLRRGLTSAGARVDIELLPSADTERSALVGAATYAHPV